MGAGTGTRARGAARTHRRLRHAAVLGVGVLVGLAVLPAVLPSPAPGTQRLSVAFAYESLIALCAALAWGPLRVLCRRPLPLSSDFRRDLGLTAGVTGLAHVVFSLQHHFDGRIGHYFFAQGRFPALPRHDTFGLGTLTGVGATVVLLVLVATSSDRLLRALGPRWKAVQRSSYALVALSAVHAVFFWVLLGRATEVRVAVAVGLVSLAAIQAAGFRSRTRARMAAALN